MEKEKNAVYLCIFPADSGSTESNIAQTICSVYSCDEPKIARTELGKPYFPERPDLHTSVSHSGKYFVCALSRTPIGIDIQEHSLRRSETAETAAPRLKKIAARFFHPAEKKYIESDTFRRFYRVWTAKEAYVKYTGRGIDSEFSRFCTICDDMPDLEVSAPAEWQTDSAHFLQIEPEKDYTLCICSSEEFELIII